MTDTAAGQRDLKKEENLSEDSIRDYNHPRRLVLCLDGTWNQRDSGTNIYHIANLVLEGKIRPPTPLAGRPEDDTGRAEGRDRHTKDREETWIQMVYYDEGVGTGLLDSATGGAFGIGLSENVRQAYDWLVERYREGDHVFIFGFSRGSFTARSLVGMIAKCGLLYRGAPMPPAQLWQGYKTMGPYPPRDRNLEGPYGKRPPAGRFRPRKYLSDEPKKPESGAKEQDAIVPWNEMTDTEKLLVTWSRRIPIECLAVYDTVGTFGIEALAIPWLRERRAQFHDTELTSLIQHGFHGLAIDEHRGNFSHIPWHRATVLDALAKPPVYGPIQQRWFMGAHSDVGGSNDDDTLSQRPLAWFIDECKRLGLAFKPRRGDEPPESSVATPDPRFVSDSYSHFAGGIWRHVVRAKRNYRRIGPPPEFKNGKEVQSYNERLDDSVRALFKREEDKINSPDGYNPPNLYEFCERTGEGKVSKPPHVYLGSKIAGFWLAIWLIVVGLGGTCIAYLAVGWRWHWLYLLALLFPVLAGRADYCESLLTHKQALETGNPEREALAGWLNLTLVIRLFATGALVLGLGFSVYWVCRGLLSHVPIADALWLLAFCVLMLQFNASKKWAALPMLDAGFGSILRLQESTTPEEVSSLLKNWLTLRESAPDAPPNYHEPRPDRLLPVHRTLWRDMIGFIPSYAMLWFAGLWVLFSLLCAVFRPEYFGSETLRLVSASPVCWLPAAAIVALIAVADYIEDYIHLGYLNEAIASPDAEDYAWPPSAELVGAGATVTWIKKWFSVAAGVCTLAAIVWLCLRQLCALLPSCLCLHRFDPPLLAAIHRPLVGWAFLVPVAIIGALLLGYSLVRSASDGDKPTRGRK